MHGARRFRLRAYALLGAVFALNAWASAPVAAQQAQGAVVPRDITVGDVFHAAVRVDLPPGASLAAPDTLALPQDVEMAGSRELRVDTAGGARRATVAYPLTAWRPGDYQLLPVAVAIVQDGVQRRVQVTLPAFTVASVLPPDTAGVEPHPAKDVLGASRLWWPILLALLVAALAAAALWAWWRRRQKPAQSLPEALPAVLPREAALSRLDALAASGLLERGEFKAFYEQLTETLRRYAVWVDPRWGVDLTTTELAGLLAARPAAGHDRLLDLLRRADLVKFARARATGEQARTDLATARQWVHDTTPEPAEPVAAGAGSEDRRVA